MTNKNEERVTSTKDSKFHIPIRNAGTVSTQGGKESIKGTTWNPSKGVREAQQRAEAQIKAEWQREQDIQSRDPVYIRLAALDETVRSLALKVTQLEAQINEWSN